VWRWWCVEGLWACVHICVCVGGIRRAFVCFPCLFVLVASVSRDMWKGVLCFPCSFDWCDKCKEITLYCPLLAHRHSPREIFLLCVIPMGLRARDFRNACDIYEVNQKYSVSLKSWRLLSAHDLYFTVSSSFVYFSLFLSLIQLCPMCAGR